MNDHPQVIPGSRRDRRKPPDTPTAELLILRRRPATSVAGVRLVAAVLPYPFAGELIL
jgi:hypothetical protein